METQRSVIADGPPVLEPAGLIPLNPFAQAMGLGLPLYCSHRLWEDVIRHGPYDLCAKLGHVIDNALAGTKADFAALDFKWRYQEEEGGKAKKVRLRVMLYQTSEGVPWVMMNLGPLPLRLAAGRSTA